MSEASQRLADGWIPECRDHPARPTPMRQAVMNVRFPLGVLPVSGFRCPVCGAERLVGSTLSDAQAQGRRLGLFGLERSTTRKILRVGNSLAVSLDPRMLAHIDPDPKPGDEVDVGVLGNHIAIFGRHKEKKDVQAFLDENAPDTTFEIPVIRFPTLNESHRATVQGGLAEGPSTGHHESIKTGKKGRVGHKRMKNEPSVETSRGDHLEIRRFG